VSAVGTVRRIAGAPASAARYGAVRLRTRDWRTASALFVVGDRIGWSIDDDATAIADTARRLGYEVAPAAWAPYARNQAVFLPSHFEALQPRWLASSHRLGLAYLHGRPGTKGFPEFDGAYETLRRDPLRVQRIQVTHGEMHELMLSAGVPPERIFRIPIGVDLANFPFADAASRGQARRVLELPDSAFVVGSLQKDGVGWGEGLEPKLIKGPDALAAVLARVRDRVPETLALLTGPARGYVMRELAARGVPYRHLRARTRPELAAAYHALDLCIVTSRQEGGPKAVLEAMAAGTPVVSTRVGQAPEILEHGRSGYLADVDDVDALTHWAVQVHDDASASSVLARAGRQTAERYALECLDTRWAALLEGFVERHSDGG
jgi:glycosyltransferase involved in cell wall biosynthesis